MICSLCLYVPGGKNILSLLLASLFSCGGVTVTKGSFILISGLEDSIPVRKDTSAQDGEQKQSWRGLSVKQRPLMHFDGSTQIHSFHSHNYINRSGLFRRYGPSQGYQTIDMKCSTFTMSQWITYVWVWDEEYGWKVSVLIIYHFPPFLKLYFHVFIEAISCVPFHMHDLLPHVMKRKGRRGIKLLVHLFIIYYFLLNKGQSVCTT